MLTGPTGKVQDLAEGEDLNSGLFATSPVGQPLNHAGSLEQIHVYLDSKPYPTNT